MFLQSLWMFTKLLKVGRISILKQFRAQARDNDSELQNVVLRSQGRLRRFAPLIT